MSPMSSSVSGNHTPVKRKPGRQPRPDKSESDGKDGPPPAKKRKVAPKERTTEYLDLETNELRTAEDKQNLDRLMAALHKKKKIVVVAGAGGDGGNGDNAAVRLVDAGFMAAVIGAAGVLGAALVL